MSLERPMYSACFCCIKIHIEMAEKSQVKHRVWYSLVALYMTILLQFLYLNMIILQALIIHNGEPRK